MNGALGHTGVLLGFAAAVIGIVVVTVGLVRGRASTLRSAPLYAPVLLLGGLLAVAAMEHALVTHDFSLTYVADNNSRTTPLLYSITGLWSALAGSILLWGVVLGGYATAMAWRFRRRASDPIVAWATLVVYAVAAFFFGLMLGPADPFAHVSGAIPANGLGPNVLLQDNPLVLFHPPLLYLGLVGFTLPFAFAIASLVTGRLEEDWQGETRRWTLFAWTFLSVGIVLGAWWSYQVLGWGGFWAWDPVENASLLPWLVGTAYLHSAMVQQRRGLLRIWNLSLVVATFSLTILGTFLTRSGVIQSVHSFSSSTIGPLLLGFFGLVLLCGVGLIAWRGDRLRSPGGIDSPISREGAFLANNLLFVAFAFVVLLGTVFPLLYEALNAGQQVTVGAPYFNRVVIPLALALLFLMAVAPALPWRKTNLAVLRSRLAVPAAIGVGVVVACVVGGLRGAEPLLAFGLGAFAAASAGRALVLSVRAAHRDARSGGAPPRRGVARGMARPGRAGERRDGRPHRGGRARHRSRRGDRVRPARGGPSRAGWVGDLRRSHGDLRHDEDGHVALPLRAAGRAARRRGRDVLAGDQPVRRGNRPGRHAGDRFELARRRLPHDRLDPRPGRCLDLRRRRPAARRLALDRRGPRRGRLGARRDPGQAAAPDRSGLGGALDRWPPATRTGATDDGVRSSGPGAPGPCTRAAGRRR